MYRISALMYMYDANNANDYRLIFSGMYEVFLLIIGSKDPVMLRVNAIGFTVICISYLVCL